MATFETLAVLQALGRRPAAVRAALCTRRWSGGCTAGGGLPAGLPAACRPPHDRCWQHPPPMTQGRVPWPPTNPWLHPSPAPQPSLAPTHHPGGTPEQRVCLLVCLLAVGCRAQEESNGNLLQLCLVLLAQCFWSVSGGGVSGCAQRCHPLGSQEGVHRAPWGAKRLCVAGFGHKCWPAQGLASLPLVSSTSLPPP